MTNPHVDGGELDMCSGSAGDCRASWTGVGSTQACRSPDQQRSHQPSSLDSRRARPNLATPYESGHEPPVIQQVRAGTLFRMLKCATTYGKNARKAAEFAVGGGAELDADGDGEGDGELLLAGVTSTSIQRFSPLSLSSNALG